MKRYLLGFLTMLFAATFAFADSGGRAAADARLQAAGTVLNEIMAAPDKGIPEEVIAVDETQVQGVSRNAPARKHHKTAAAASDAPATQQ